MPSATLFHHFQSHFTILALYVALTNMLFTKIALGKMTIDSATIGKVTFFKMIW
jgi:hypothetical protein